MLILGWVAASVFAWLALFSYEKNVRSRMSAEIYEGLVQGGKERILVLTEELSHESLRHIKIESDLRQQVQALAQQLATIRVEHPGARPEQERFEPTPEPPKPYSQQLTDFLLRIDYAEARLLVEEDIERFRQQDYDDEQIYSFLTAENY